MARLTPRAWSHRPVPGARAAASPATSTPRSGRSAARLARLLREQEVESSNLSAPTTPFPDRISGQVWRRPGAVLVVIVACLWALAAAAQEVPRYTVRKGDSLSLISGKFYQDVLLWPIVYDANRSVVGSNPNLIQPGMRLGIPDISGLSSAELSQTRERGRNWR